MKIVEKTRTYTAYAERVFSCLDDLGVTGMHMTKSSMPMMGGKMDFQFLTEKHTGAGTRYRWTGKVLWMTLDFTVTVTKWVMGVEKSWQTEKNARMIIMSWFRMDLKVEQYGQHAMVKLYIAYERPEGIFNRLLSVLLADWYCKWCVENMLQDTEERLKGARNDDSDEIEEMSLKESTNEQPNYN